jgi:hypothetical protein
MLKELILANLRKGNIISLQVALIISIVLICLETILIFLGFNRLSVIHNIIGAYFNFIGSFLTLWFIICQWDFRVFWAIFPITMLTKKTPSILIDFGLNSLTIQEDQKRINK